MPCRRGVGSMVNRRPPNPVFRVRIPAPLPLLTQTFSCSIIQAYPLSWSACMIRHPNCACKICGKQLFRKPCTLKCSTGNVYCNQVCYGISRRKPRAYPAYGKKFFSQRNSKHCNRACANVSRIGMKYRQPGAFRKDKVKDAQSLKKRLIQARGASCQRCGYADVNILTVHHIIRRSDGGSNELENLELVCPTCHTEIHFYGVKHSKRGIAKLT